MPVGREVLASIAQSTFEFYREKARWEDEHPRETINQLRRALYRRRKR